MKVLINIDNYSAPYFVRTGWARVLQYCGHNVILWDSNQKSAFDVFTENPKIDFYLGTTYGFGDDLVKISKKNPEMKIALFCSAWGKYTEKIDRQNYPIVYVTDEEKTRLEKLKKEVGKPDFVFLHISDQLREQCIGGWDSVGIKSVGILNGADLFAYYGGQYKENLKSQIAFIGGYWPYKSRNLSKLVDLCNLEKYDIKIWGNGNWGIPNYLGTIQGENEKHAIASCEIALNLSEPHSTDLNFDIVERCFKVPLNAFMISDRVKELDYVFTGKEVPQFESSAQLAEMVEYYLKDLNARFDLAFQQRQTVLGGHTYFHRVEKMFAHLELYNECEKVKDAYIRFKKENNVC